MPSVCVPITCQTLTNAGCSGTPLQHVAPMHTPRCHKQQRHYSSPAMLRMQETTKVMTEAQQSPSNNQATQADPFPDSRAVDSTIQPVVEIIDLTKDVEVRCGHMLKDQFCLHKASDTATEISMHNHNFPTPHHLLRSRGPQRFHITKVYHTHAQCTSLTSHNTDIQTADYATVHMQTNMSAPLPLHKFAN